MLRLMGKMHFRRLRIIKGWDLAGSIRSSMGEPMSSSLLVSWESDCGLIGGDVLNQGWIEGAVVPWVILKIGGDSAAQC